MLYLILIGLVVTSFVVAGLTFGLLAIGLAFISTMATRPLAARLASRIYARVSNSGGGYVGLPPRALEKISHELAKPFDPQRLREEIASGKTSAQDSLLDYCEQQSAIQAVLREFQVSRQELQEEYKRLIMAGAGQWTCGHWVAASALAYPASLRYLLARRKGDLEETAFKLIMFFERGTELR